VTLADSTTLGADLTIAKSSWLREPLLHFAVLAGLLFLADYQASRAQKHEIVVSRQTAEYLIKQREDLKMRELSAEERQAAIDQFIEEEILYNEAYKRGLDRGDSRMRRNLILKMRGLLASEVDDPSEEELLAWYRQNIDRYTISESWSFEQVFFSDPAAVPDSLLIRLREGLDRSAAVAEAVRIRARPIYLSTLTSIFGMLPLMLVPGVGSQIYRGLATVIIGGMLVSALFTLILMPSILRLAPLELRRAPLRDQEKLPGVPADA
jgi:hypothetical protein